MSRPNQAIEQEDETKSLWRNFAKIRKTPGGGNYMVNCTLCDFEFNGFYTRVRAHLLKIKGEGVRVCPKVNPSKLDELKRLDNEATLKIENSRRKRSLYHLYMRKESRQAMVVFTKNSKVL